MALPSLLPLLLMASHALADQTALRDARGPVQMEATPPFLLTLSLLLLVGIVYWLVRRGARGNTVRQSPPPPQDDPMEALDRLTREFRLGNCPGTLLAQQLEGWSRDALAAAKGVPARRLTSAETVMRSAAVFPDSPETVAALARILHLGDRVKFAGHEPSAEEIQAMLSAAGQLRQALEGAP